MFLFDADGGGSGVKYFMILDMVAFGGGFFPTCEYFVERSDDSFPTCTFLF